MWYSWFGPEGSINPQNSTFLGFHFVPRDLDSRRRGPRLAAPWDLDSNLWRRGPLRRELRSPAQRVEVPCGYTTPHYYPKYEIWTIEKKLVNNPFKVAKLVKIFNRVSLVKLLNLLIQWLELESLSVCLSINVNWSRTVVDNIHRPPRETEQYHYWPLDGVHKIPQLYNINSQNMWLSILVLCFSNVISL